MTIEVETVNNEVGTVCKQIRFLHQLSWQAFQELIHRGANLWPDAPPEIKKFADIVTNGYVSQDYSRERKLTTQQTGPGFYDKCTDVKSEKYNRCAHCGKHLSQHWFHAGAVTCEKPENYPS